MREITIAQLDRFGGAIVVTDVAFKFARQVLDRGEEAAGNDLTRDPGEPVSTWLSQEE